MFYSNNNNKIMNFKSCIEKVKPFIKLCLVYFIWVCIHCISIQLYSSYCANTSVYGLFQSLLNVQSPHCRGLRYMSDAGVYMMQTFWSSIALWLTTELIKIFPLLKIYNDKKIKTQEYNHPNDYLK